MRNLKRVLSLALALVMMLSLMIVGAGAAEAKKVNFTDANEIGYTEAVDVMTALGVIQGTDKGAFNPQGTLTREAAAKIICYMLLGPENAEKLTTNTQIFTDVAAGRWSAGYIAYCANLNILAGTGDGSFNPEGALTGVAFGKMLLIALGYDPAIQGYVGSNWATAIATDMLDAGIDVKGTTLSDPLTREQAAQMAFQTLTADMVKYDQKGTTVNMGDGASVIVNASKPEAVGNTSTDYTASDGKYLDGTSPDETQQFCEKYFSDLRKTAKSGDELGRPGYDWVYDGASIGTYSDDAKYVLKGNFTSKDLYNELGKSVVTSDRAWVVYEDGVELTDTAGVDDAFKDAVAAKDSTKCGDFQKSSADIVTTIGNGTRTEVFVDKTTITVCIINTYAGTVDKVYTEDDVKDDEKPYVTVDNLDFETTAFEEDDVVLYTKGRDDSNAVVIVTMALAEEIEGEITKVTNDKDFTVNGTKYEYSATFGHSGDSKVATSSVDKDALFYVDSEGYVVKIGQAKTSNDYAVVIAVGMEDNRYDSSKKTSYAKLLLTDGSIVAVELDNVPSTITAAEGAGNSLESEYLGHIVTYTVDKGKYELTVKSSDPAEAKSYIDIVSGKATIVAGSSASATVRVNDETVFLVCNDKDDEDYTAYVGYKAVPDISKKTGTLITYYADGSKPAKVVYVEGGEVKSDGTDSVIFIRANSSAPVVKEAGGKEYREFDAVVDGKVTKIQVAESALASGQPCFELRNSATGTIIAVKSLSYNSKDLVTKYTKYSSDTASDTYYTTGIGTTKVNAGVVGFGGETYGWADDVVVAKYDDTAKTKLTISSISAIKTDTNDKVVVVVDKNDVVGVFITVEPGNHHAHSLTHHEAAAANSTTHGTIEYWECTDCHKLYNDAGAADANEVTAAELVVHNYAPAPVTAGANAGKQHIDTCTVAGCGDTTGKTATNHVFTEADSKHTCTCGANHTAEYKDCTGTTGDDHTDANAVTLDCKSKADTGCTLTDTCTTSH